MFPTMLATALVFPTTLVIVHVIVLAIVLASATVHATVLVTVHVCLEASGRIPTPGTTILRISGLHIARTKSSLTTGE